MEEKELTVSNEDIVIGFCELKGAVTVLSNVTVLCPKVHKGVIAVRHAFFKSCVSVDNRSLIFESKDSIEDLIWGIGSSWSSAPVYRFVVSIANTFEDESFEAIDEVSELTLKVFIVKLFDNYLNMVDNLLPPTLYTHKSFYYFVLFLRRMIYDCVDFV